ncbi:MAG: sigma-70 family RNA polymerase sigma factor [Verrucomicrobia bacterium]|nr:sigma-70 family RNA polymerase sigma factor [Verrucomicrobiota bacterium]
MNSDDMALVREFAQSNSEQAFARLVSQHVNLVYSVAMRQVRDPHLAKEVTQSVFIILAGKAKSLSPKTILSGWLCRTARYVSANTLSIQRRRQYREQEAHMESILNEPEPGVWNQIAPMLDEALNCLGEKEHDAVVLRFFDGKELKQVGAAMGTTEDAARMRVNRGLEKLREYFTKKGVTLSATAIAGAVAANSVQAAPAGLAAVITTAALSGTTITTAAVIAATKGIAMTTLQKTVIAAAFAVAVGTGIYEARQAVNARAEVQTLQQQQAPFNEQIQQLTKDRDEATRQLAALREDNELLNRNTRDLLGLRAEVTRLRKGTEAVALSTKTHSVLDTSDPNWEPNWVVLRPFDLSLFPDSTTKITTSRAKDVGIATPTALLQTWIWAQRVGDAAGILKTWDFPEGTTDEQKMERLNEALRDGEYARQHPDSNSEESSVRDLFSLKDGYYLAFIEEKQRTTGAYVSYQVFRRVGDEWKVSFGKSKK